MINELQELGLSYYESKALEAILQGEVTALELSKKAKIPPGKIYSIILELEKKGIILKTESRPQKVYVESASSVLKSLIQERENRYEKTISKLRELATQMDISRGRKPKFFHIGTSIEETKEIQMRTFVEAEKEVCQIINIHHKPKTNRKSKTAWERAIVEATKRGVVFRTIYPVNCVLPKILAELHQRTPEKFQVKRLNLDFIRCDLIDGKKVLLKLLHQDALNFAGVLFIENKNFAINLKAVFNNFWEEAE